MLLALIEFVLKTKIIYFQNKFILSLFSSVLFFSS